MIYRAFKHKESGRWLGTLMTASLEWRTAAGAHWEEPDFAVPQGRHLSDVLPAYASHGWTPEEIEVVDATEDPRAGVFIDPDPAEVDPDEERLESLHALLAAQDLTHSQVSEMLRLERNL